VEGSDAAFIHDIKLAQVELIKSMRANRNDCRVRGVVKMGLRTLDDVFGLEVCLQCISLPHLFHLKNINLSTFI
jgi:hypothetical protein